MTTSVVQRSDLGPPGSLIELGRGGEGVVFGLESDPAVVYKEYLPRTGLVLNGAALAHLVDLPEQLPAPDRAVIRSRTAWPTALVVDGSRLLGYLMPRIPGEYWRTHGALHDPRHVVCEWNYLTYRQQWAASSTIVSDVPVLPDDDIMKLLADLAKTTAVLHRHGIVMGDVSGRNLLWTDQPGAKVFVIDCDAFRPEGHDAVNPPKESPDWGDPAIERSATTRASDIYKLGLAAYRALWSATSGRPPASLAPKEGVPETIVDLILRSVRLEGRPTADEWALEMTSIVKFSGRPVVRLGTAAQPSAPTTGSPAHDTTRGKPPTGPGTSGTGRPSIPVH
jgi:hypothetical protein